MSYLTSDLFSLFHSPFDACQCMFDYFLRLVIMDCNSSSFSSQSALPCFRPPALCSHKWNGDLPQFGISPSNNLEVFLTHYFLIQPPLSLVNPTLNLCLRHSHTHKHTHTGVTSVRLERNGQGGTRRQSKAKLKCVKCDDVIIVVWETQVREYRMPGRKREWERHQVKTRLVAQLGCFYSTDSREESVLGSIPLPSYTIAPVGPEDHISRKYAFKVRSHLARIETLLKEFWLYLPS